MKDINIWINGLEKFNYFLNKGMGFVAGVGLISVMLVMVANMIMRIVHQPIVGTYDYVSWSGVVTVSFALGYTQLFREHVSVNFVLHQLPSTVSKSVKALSMLVSAVFFALLSWWLFDLTQTMYHRGSSSQALSVPQYPFVFLVCLGHVGMTVALTVDFLHDMMSALGQEELDDEPGLDNISRPVAERVSE